MGVDTKGYVSSNVTAKDIYDVAVQLYGDAKFDVRERNSNDSPYGYIDINDGTDNRSLFIVQDINEEAYQKDMMFSNKKYTYLSLDKWGNSVEIMMNIVSKFGGYVDEDDCDSIDAWETVVPCDENFEFGEFIKKQNEIIEAISKDVSLVDRIKIARVIMRNSEEIKKLL